MSRRKKLLIASIATIVSLVIAELGARIYFWAADEVPPTGDLSLRNEWTWADGHLRGGTVPNESDYLHDPDTGWRVRPEVAAERSLRQPDLPPDAPHILFVGDSYTFGLGVDGSETFSSVLGRTFQPPWRVTNLAVPGTGTDQQLLTFERRDPQIRPDVVVLGFFVRDFSRNVVTFRDFAKPRFVVDGDGLRLVGTPVPSPRALFEEYSSGRRQVGEGVGSYLIGAVAAAMANLRARSIDEDTEGWQVLARIMTRFDREVRAAGAVPVWLIIPYRDSVEDGESRFEPIEILCEAQCERLGMACLRLDGPFRVFVDDHPDQSPFRPKEDGGHLSIAGHRVAAEALHALLRDRGLASPASGD